MSDLISLNLDLPRFSEIRAAKDVPFPSSVAQGPQIIFPTMNDWQAAILRAISPQSEPSDDPHLSSLVAAAITWLGTTLPEPDLQVRKEFLRKAGGKKKEDNVIEKHPLYNLMNRPNPYMSSGTLWKAFANSWIISGNAYWLKFRNDFGQVVQLWNEPYFNVKARWVNDKQGEYIPASRSQSRPIIPRNDESNQFINYYEITRDGAKFRVEPDDIVHFREGEDPLNRRYGLSRLTTVLREIYGDSAAASYAARLLSGNGVIPYVLGVDDKEGALGQEDFQNLKTLLNAQTTGANAGQPLVIGSRVTFSRTGLTPADLDIRTSRYMAQEIVASVLGIPAIVLNYGAGAERSIYNNVSEAYTRAVESYLQPLWWHIAQELTHQLLPEFDQDETHFVEFDISEVGALQEDENDKVNRIAALYEKGIIKRSEARTEFNYEVAPDGADDVYYVRGGSETVTLEQEAEKQDLALNPPEPPANVQQFPAVADGKTGGGLLRGAKAIHHLANSSEQNRIREHWERHAPERVKGLISARGK